MQKIIGYQTSNCLLLIKKRRLNERKKDVVDIDLYIAFYIRIKNKVLLNFHKIL